MDENAHAVIVGETPLELPLPALVAARTAIVGYATAVGASLVVFAGTEVHVMLHESEKVLLDGRIKRLEMLFDFWGIKPTVMKGAAAMAHAEALTK